MLSKHYINALTLLKEICIYTFFKQQSTEKKKKDKRKRQNIKYNIVVNILNIIYSSKFNY